MTASRTCRACGANLKGDVMWCLRCYEPVRQLTPRAPQPAALPVARPRDQRPMSRWKAGATTFGPFGRLGITALVMLFAPWSLNGFALFVLWPPYLVLAGLVLRGAWRKDYVKTMTVAEMVAAGRSSRASPPLRTPIPRATAVAWMLLTILGLGVGAVWISGGQVLRGSIGICASLTALVLAVRWFARD